MRGARTAGGWTPLASSATTRLSPRARRRSSGSSVNRLSATPHAATAISTPPDSAGAWLRERPVLIGDRKWLRRNRGSIREAESARPGVADKLRPAPLELLQYPDSGPVWRSMALLAAGRVAGGGPG